LHHITPACTIGVRYRCILLSNRHERVRGLTPLGRNHYNAGSVSDIGGVRGGFSAHPNGKDRSGFAALILPSKAIDKRQRTRERA
jgi:hypothetical protein